MKMNVIIKVILVALYFFSTSAISQTLWNGVNYGMSYAEVFKKFPDAQKVKPENADRIGAGDSALIILKNIDIYGKIFEANLYFDKQNKISQVMLTCANCSRLADFMLLEDGLKAKYGTPLFSQKRDLHASATFISGRVNIELLYIDVGSGMPPLLNVVYQTRRSRESSKL